ncbi:hypothetical protein ROJ8625_01041 [Roseivivax jejudonensis]|uniref:Uncharacterized protein n=2 Tax=Roseivivax jejudonensis TaxID=1529041 RepID=A0A1X6YMW5_9RHOB|nr:hypothetical protein ROJ8625_01041 [Roseivivax jejudonensis]
MAQLGEEATLASLRQSFGFFENFECAREFVGDKSHAQEFRYRVGDAAFNGMDSIRLDAAGKVSDLVVLVRPVSDIMKRGEEAAR